GAHEADLTLESRRAARRRSARAFRLVAKINMPTDALDDPHASRARITTLRHALLIIAGSGRLRPTEGACFSHPQDRARTGCGRSSALSASGFASDAKSARSTDRQA